MINSQLIILEDEFIYHINSSIKDYINRNNISIRDISEKTGISYSRLEKYLKFETPYDMFKFPFTINELIKIFYSFGLKIDVVFKHIEKY